MSFSFKNILIPADLTINTEVAINKALELTDTNATIHLLYVQNVLASGINGIAQRYLIGSDELPGYSAVVNYLEQWKRKIEENKPGITVNIWNILSGSIQREIEIRALKLAVDLVIIGKKSHHSWFPFLNTVVPSNISRKTGIAVLTVRPGSVHNKIKTMVVPITGENAEHKMEVIAAICGKFKIKIYLVTFLDRENRPSDFYASRLLQVYQWLKSSHYPVEYAVLHGSNKAKAILNYAEKINADILLVQPESETKIGWPGKHISDVLPLGSKVQVLAV